MMKKIFSVIWKWKYSELSQIFLIQCSYIESETMALIDELSGALKEAMKAKDKPKLDAIRQVQTEIAKKKSEKGEEATDELVLGVISSYVKKMTKAVEEYKSLGDRGTEMAGKIQFEIDFLSGWLPEQLSEEEVTTIIDEVLSEMGSVDLSQMGKIIGAVMAKADGLDGSVVSKLVREKIS